MLAWFFERERAERAPRASMLWLSALYAAGAIGWAYVLGWGNGSLNYHDWAAINLPRLRFLQNALQEGVVPLHMAGGGALHGVTDRFLTLPDVITSPQVLLLLVMPITSFVMVDVWIQYSIGFAGLVMLRRYFGWSLFTFSLVAPLVLFNGHILAHYAVGHLTWGPYFVLPWVVLFIFRFLDGDDSWRLIAKLAGAMFYMVLAGGQHHLTWVLLLLALLTPFCGRRAWWPAPAAVAAVALSAVRLLPPALELSSFRSAGLVSDVVGYPSLSHLLTALVALRRERDSFDPSLPGNLWFFDSSYYEFSVYTGAAGLAIVVIGAYHWLKAGRPRYAELIVPIIVLTILSLGSTYRVVRMLSMPLLEGERYLARLFILPLLLLIVLAAASVDEIVRRPVISAWHRVLALAALAFVIIDIVAAMRLWRVPVAQGVAPEASFDPAIAAVIHRADQPYVAVIVAGLLLTITTALVLGWLSRRTPERRG